MNYEFPNPGPVNTDIRIAGGVLNVDAGEHDAITVSVEPFDGSSASREAAEQTRVTLDGKQLNVHVPHEKGWAIFRWPKVNINVRVPIESALTIKSASADVKCTGVYADALVTTASGDVNVDRVLKDASVHSASGNVRMGSVGGTTHIISASGDVDIQKAGRDIDANAASGDIQIRQADGSVKAKTASGDITLGMVHTGETRVHSASGDVSIGVVAGTGVWLDVSTLSGRTSSDLSMHSNVEAPPSASAALKIKARTASGDITVRRVPAAV